MEVENIPFPDAVRKLAQQAGMVRVNLEASFTEVPTLVKGSPGKPAKTTPPTATAVR